MECLRPGHANNKVHIPGDVGAQSPRAGWLLRPFLGLQMTSFLCPHASPCPQALCLHPLYKDLHPTYGIIFPL